MKKKIGIFVCICLLPFIFTGCNKGEMQQAVVNLPKKENSESYLYSPNSRFKIVLEENINDGMGKGIWISILVDKETKVMYMLTEKVQGGYGMGLQIMVDESGKPLIYNID
jgi:hypothetical protein